MLAFEVQSLPKIPRQHMVEEETQTREDMPYKHGKNREEREAAVCSCQAHASAGYREQTWEGRTAITPNTRAYKGCGQEITYKKGQKKW